MRLEKVYKYQLFLYIFIIAFGIQNYYLSNYNFNWGFYEDVVKYVFILSFITILLSLALLTYGSVKSINRKETKIKEILFLITNLFMYYCVILISFYLATQARL